MAGLYHREQRVAQPGEVLKEGGFTALDEHMRDSQRHQRKSPVLFRPSCF